MLSAEAFQRVDPGESMLSDGFKNQLSKNRRIRDFRENVFWRNLRFRLKSLSRNKTWLLSNLHQEFLLFVRISKLVWSIETP